MSTPQRQFKSFECGFEFHHFQAYVPTLHFFKTALIFIIFDLELVYLLALYSNVNWSFTLLLIVFLGGGLVAEYRLYSLN